MLAAFARRRALRICDPLARGLSEKDHAAKPVPSLPAAASCVAFAFCLSALAAPAALAQNKVPLNGGSQGQSQGQGQQQGAPAAPDASVPQVSECDGPVTQAEMNACQAALWQAADAELNAAYGEARAYMVELDANLSQDRRGAADKLREAQRAWITFRDAACAAAGWPMRGGTAEPLLVNGCLTELTRQRTAQLRDLLAYR